MNAGELGLKIGFDGNDALAGINNLITKFAILRASALQIIDTFEALGKATIGEGVADRSHEVEALGKGLAPAELAIGE